MEKKNREIAIVVKISANSPFRERKKNREILYLPCNIKFQEFYYNDDDEKKARHFVVGFHQL